MAGFMGFLFGENDAFLVDQIAKEHKVDKEIVEKHYKVMLENISNEIQNKI